MYLQELYYNILTTKEFAVIGREFSAYGMEYALVGLVNTNDRTELVLLEYDEQLSDDDCCTEPESMTNRELALTDKDMRKGLTELLKEVEICGKKLNIGASNGCMLDEISDSETYKITEFMKQGWKSEKFFDYPPDCVFIHFVEFEESVESFAQFDLSHPIRLVAYETYKEEFPMIKLELEVDKDLEKTVSLFDGEDKICIKRVNLVDISEEKSIDKEYISKICPEGMRIPVIEYTCDGELCFDISLSSHLDSIFGNNYNGFSTEDGVIGVVIGIQLADNKDDRKYLTIQQAVKSDTKRIKCEIIRCSKEIENPRIEEFLI